MTTVFLAVCALAILWELSDISALLKEANQITRSRKP